MSARKTGYAVNWILNRTHVGTSYEAVAAEFVRRMEGKPFTARERSETITNALIQHRRNGREYNWIMGGH
jgi:hypothetical protein